jgi:1-acyl-sn-glycerol-3-phosphate acyltransferase
MSVEPAPIAKRQLAWFTKYVTWYLRRNFHGVHLLRLTGLEQLEEYPLLVCLNHPSWWDPLMGLYLSQKFFPTRAHYAPIAAAGLAKYKFFERLGFFGIDPETRAGAARFLRVGEAVLRNPDGAFWVTPQGEFTDVRLRPLGIQPGVAHLARRLQRFAMLPLALEYTFWKERFPEAFACFGRPILAESGVEHSAAEWMRLFANALESTADALAAKVQTGDAAAFEPLLKGRAGVGGVYDLWRASKARFQGKTWNAEHGAR